MSTFEQLLGSLDEPVLEMDTSGLVTFTTTTAREWTGRDSNYQFAEIVQEDEKSRFEHAFQRVVEGKTLSAKVELSIHTAAGEPLPMEVKLSAIASEGKVTGVSVWLRDLSLEKANEAAANVQGTHLMDLVENVTDACVVESMDGTIEMVNEAFCDLFGVKAAAQSLIGTFCNEAFASAAESTEKKVAPIYFPMDSDKADQFEFTLLDGRSVEQRSLPVAGPFGISGRLHVFRTKQVVASGESKSTATSSAQMVLIERIARDLATAVESAGSAITRAEQLDLPGPLLEQFHRVESSAHSAFASIASLLDFSRVEASDLTLERADFRLREHVAAMFDRLAPLAESRGVQLRLKIEQDVPNQLNGDGARLMLCLRNLMECALPDAERGAELSFTIEPEYAADNVIHLSFIVVHTQPKGSARAKAMTPTGSMQLALARQIARALGGGGSGAKIDIKERKESITFQFTAAFPYRSIRDARTRPTFVTLTGMPVLLVSADLEERKQLAEMAMSWRMYAREADNGGMALQLLSRMAAEGNPIPLVVLSNELPVQDGFLLAFRIKHHNKLKQTAVVMLAKSGRPGDAIACRENGISAYLRHPIAPAQLNEAISAVMGTQDDDSEATATLITRHSLREAKAGSVLFVDPAREAIMVVSGVLKKRDFGVAHAESAEGAAAMIDQEEFDFIIVEPATPGFVAGTSVVQQLRTKLGARADKTKILLATADANTGGANEYDGVVKKPYGKDALLKSLGAAKVEASD